MNHTKMILVGGWCLVLFSILFIGLTILLDNVVQHQPMLYGLERHALFKVMAGTDTIRYILVLFSVTPLLLIPGAVGAYYNFIDKHEANMRVGMYFATTGAIGLTLSLMMLPSINWHLATYIQTLKGVDQGSMIIILQSLHSYFGVFVGDMLGLGCILVWFFITSFVMLRSSHIPHIVGTIELILAILAALILLARYSGIAPNLYLNIQVSGIIALWVFVCGIGLISLRK